jgi:predicted PurR-regulated permease PerM
MVQQGQGEVVAVAVVVAVVVEVAAVVVAVAVAAVAVVVLLYPVVLGLHAQRRGMVPRAAAAAWGPTPGGPVCP